MVLWAVSGMNAKNDQQKQKRARIGNQITEARLAMTAVLSYRFTSMERTCQPKQN